MENSVITMPMVPLRGLVIYPDMTTNFEAVRPFSVAALNYALTTERKVFLVTQKTMTNNPPTMNELYSVGIVANLKYQMKLNEGVRVMVDGLYRARLLGFYETNGFYSAEVERFGTELYDEELITAYRRSIISAMNEYTNISGRLDRAFMSNVADLNTIEKLIDTAAINILPDVSQRQEILECESVEERAEKLISMLNTECRYAEIDNEINKRTRVSLEKSQKEAYLREQISSIQEELGEGGDANIADEFRAKVRELPLKEADMEKVMREIDRLSMIHPSSPDYMVSRSYVEWILAMPFNKYTEDNLDIENAREILNRDHYGMEKVKDRILEFLAVRSLTKGKQGSIICFAGPPGVGKTSISKSIAEALGRKFVRMSLGGVHDEAEIRGHRRTYIGAIPGRIISGIKEAGTMNPVFLLDEIDKMAGDFRGDPASAMLEVLDPTTNTSFNDHYLDIDFDLSDVIFLTTANDIDQIPRPLFDRMEIINLESYTAYEKLQIAKNHLVPKQTEAHGLKKSILKIEDSAIESIITGYTFESGVRELERVIGKVCRKAAVQYLSGKKRMIVKSSNIEKYAGKERIFDTALPKKDSVGIDVGLAWTSGGGTTMPIEATLIKGGGGIELTGQLGDVMKESAKIAYAYLRANSKKYGIDLEMLKEYDMHIHVPEGATPKDGPSAGITMCLAMLSAITGKKIRHDVAMTGEITLMGRVLPIGGLKEKSLAALRVGIHTIFIPKANMKDVEEMPQEVLKELDFKPVTDFAEVAEMGIIKD